MITDESRNGTVILQDDGQNLKIQKESKEVPFTAESPLRILIKTKINIYQLTFYPTGFAESAE